MQSWAVSFVKGTVYQEQNKDTETSKSLKE